MENKMQIQTTNDNDQKHQDINNFTVGLDDYLRRFGIERAGADRFVQTDIVPEEDDDDQGFAPR